MIHALVIVALAFVGAALLLLVLLASRRTVLARRDRRYAEGERRVRPLAIALVEGQNGEQPALSSADQAVLADVLRRYSRKLTGDADARVAAYFRDKPAVRVALRDLRGRRMWRRAAAAYRLGDMADREVAGRGGSSWVSPSPSCRCCWESGSFSSPFLRSMAPPKRSGA